MCCSSLCAGTNTAIDGRYDRDNDGRSGRSHRKIAAPDCRAKAPVARTKPRAAKSKRMFRIDKNMATSASMTGSQVRLATTLCAPTTGGQFGGHFDEALGALGGQAGVAQSSLHRLTADSRSHAGEAGV